MILYTQKNKEPYVDIFYTFHVRNKVIVHPCTGIEALTGRTAHRVSRVIALPFHDHATRSG